MENKIWNPNNCYSCFIIARWDLLKTIRAKYLRRIANLILRLLYRLGRFLDTVDFARIHGNSEVIWNGGQEATLRLKVPLTNPLSLLNDHGNGINSDIVKNRSPNSKLIRVYASSGGYDEKVAQGRIEANRVCAAVLPINLAHSMGLLLKSLYERGAHDCLNLHVRGRWNALVYGLGAHTLIIDELHFHHLVFRVSGVNGRVAEFNFEADGATLELLFWVWRPHWVVRLDNMCVAIFSDETQPLNVIWIHVDGVEKNLFNDEVEIAQ